MLVNGSWLIFLWLHKTKARLSAHCSIVVVFSLHFQWVWSRCVTRAEPSRLQAVIVVAAVVVVVGVVGHPKVKAKTSRGLYFLKVSVPSGRR